MALLVRGKTICGLCSKPIGEDDEVFGVPPLIANTLDPVFRYGDRVFHANCIRESADYERLASLIRLYEERSSGRISFLSGRPITSPDDFLSFPHLGDTPSLSELSFRVFSKSDLSGWSALPEIVRTLENMNVSGAWGGSVLVKLVEDLKALLPLPQAK